jgi:chemotaxis protein MotB
VSKKGRCPEFENHERWLVSFADMMTLLFAVFVVLFALKKEGAGATIEQAASAINEEFNTVLEEVPIERRVGPQEAGIGIFDNFKGNQARPPLIKKYPGETENIKVMDSEMKRINAQLEDRLYGPEKNVQAGKEGAERVVSVHRSPDGVRLRLLASHFYEPGEYKLRRTAVKELEAVGKILKELGRNITIEGHTDNSSMKGDMTNWELSTLRATAVLRYLIEKENFSPTRIQAAGYADTRPIADNRSPGGRSLNRRIEIRINYDN